MNLSLLDRVAQMQRQCHLMRQTLTTLQTRDDRARPHPRDSSGDIPTPTPLQRPLDELGPHPRLAPGQAFVRKNVRPHRAFA